MTATRPAPPLHALPGNAVGQQLPHALPSNAASPRCHASSPPAARALQCSQCARCACMRCVAGTQCVASCEAPFGGRHDVAVARANASVLRTHRALPTRSFHPRCTPLQRRTPRRALL
jgi:hypothetical protein